MEVNQVLSMLKVLSMITAKSEMNSYIYDNVMEAKKFSIALGDIEKQEALDVINKYGAQTDCLLQLPYKLCYFEFLEINCAILLKVIDSDKPVIHCIPFFKQTIVPGKEAIDTWEKVTGEKPDSEWTKFAVESFKKQPLWQTVSLSNGGFFFIDRKELKMDYFCTSFSNEDIEKDERVNMLAMLILYTIYSLINITDRKNKYIDVDTIVPSKKLNNKRIKNGRIPFFEYKIIKIKLSEEQLLKRKNDSDKKRNSPKYHTRHGFYRHFTKGRLAGTKKWIDDMKVGKIENGILIKDYKVE